MDICTISNNDIVLDVSLTGAEPISLKTGDRQWIVQHKNDDGSGLSPILFPMIGPCDNGEHMVDGQVYPMPMHGFAKSSVFDVEHITDTSVTLVLSSDETTLKIYPYRFKLAVTYTIDNNRLITEYVVTNNDNKVMHYAIGSHIGFCLNTDKGNYSILFDVDMEHNDKMSLYSRYGKSVFDGSTLYIKDEFFAKGCFTIGNHQSKSWQFINGKDGSIISYSSNDFPYITLFSVPHEPFLCIEPWSFRSGHYCKAESISELPEICELDRGESKSYTYTLEFNR